MKHLILSLVFLPVFANAKTFEVFVETTAKETWTTKSYVFSKYSFGNFPMSKDYGTPSLPLKTLLLKGKPEDIRLSATKKSVATFQSLPPMPSQPSKCRCGKENPFVYHPWTYLQPDTQIKKTYLGKYRGEPITRVDVPLALWLENERALEVFNQLSITTNNEVYSFSSRQRQKMLIVVSEALLTGIHDFVTWKESLGFQVIVKSIQSPSKSTSAIKNIISNSYHSDKIDFVIIVGDMNHIPTFTVETAFNVSTPTDHKYFTMDGADDLIPDILSGRIVANSPQQVKLQLAKSIAYERAILNNSFPKNRMVGVASNEGHNPTDNEYLFAIEAMFRQYFASETTHFFEDDPRTNPTSFNQVLTDGALWVTYMGHGNGEAWESFFQKYTLNDISGTRYPNSTLPVVLDVSCENGGLLPEYFGATFVNPSLLDSRGSGAVAYYGGSVDISWHPPAIMAQLITEEHGKNNFLYLGEALLAGQIRLAQEWPNVSEYEDNLEWYHLQGDPSLMINFKDWY